jgi:hypothetical protein
VVADSPWRLESLDGRITRPLFTDEGHPHHDFNDLRIVTHIWKSPEILALRRQVHDGLTNPVNTDSTKRLVSIHLASTVSIMAAVGLATASIGLSTLLLSVVFGAWLGHRFAGRRQRSWNVKAGLRSAGAHAVFGAIAYVFAWIQWPEQLEPTASQLIWAAPAVGFLVGLPALAAVILVGDVIAHVSGGYVDEQRNSGQ